MSVTLDPTVLPALDIIKLAQSGHIVRTERRTEENGIPCFISRKDWEQLKAEHEPFSSQGTETLLTALERTTGHFLQEAAKTCLSLKKDPRYTTLPSSFEIESDLFSDHRTISMLFVKDTTYSVVCAVMSTSPNLLQFSCHDTSGSST